MSLDWCHLCKRHVKVESRPLRVAEPNRVEPKMLTIGESVTKQLCLGCHCSWYECDSTCKLGGFRHLTRAQHPCRFSKRANLFRHIRKFHLQSQASPVDDTPDPFDVPDDLDPLEPIEQNEPDEGLQIEWDEPSDPSLLVDSEFTRDPQTLITSPTLVLDIGVPAPTPQQFTSPSLNDHLRNCQTSDYYTATKRLVFRAAHQNKFPPEEKIGSPWLICFLYIARIVMLTTAEVHELLSTVLVFFNGIAKLFLVPRNLYPSMPLPLTPYHFQSMITNGSNSNSLKSILPVPHLEHNPETEHSYSSLTELVPMTMFMPPSSCVTKGVCDRYSSSTKSELFFSKRNMIPAEYLNNEDVPTVLVFVSLWSDGWDPSRLSKNNRHPVWTATGTMIFVEIGTPDKPYLANTVLMGVGPGKESHEEFFDMLVNEKRTRWEGEDGRLHPFLFYSKHHGKEVHAFITLSLALQDNPERRSSAELLSGNSNTHGIFGVSCDFGRLEVPFEACQRCQDRLLNYVKCADFTKDCVDYECKDCLGWSIDKLCLKGKYKRTAGTAGKEALVLEPTEVGYDILQKPCRISFDDCIKAWNYATKMFVNERKWTASKAKRYLKLFCCNEQLQNRFLKESRLYLNILNSLSDNAESIFEPEDLARYRRLSRTPEYRLPKHPAFWLLFSIEDISETPMHLMMGAIKALLKSLLRYTVCRDKQQDFIRRCNEILKSIQDLRVDIAPVMKFKDDKFGGFVAENYSAMAMLVPWLSHVLEEHDCQPGEKNIAPDPTAKPVSKWNGKECKAWLAERGIKGTSKMDAATAKEEVCGYFQKGITLAVVPNPGREMAGHFVRSLLLFSNALFSTIMLMDMEGYEARNRALALVSLFLSKYDFVDQNLVPDRKEPVWLAKYNILGLLRVPEHFLRHRHFRNQYEGGENGEGIVKDLRPLCPNAVRGGWSRNLILKFYRNQSLDAMCDEAKSSWKDFALFQKPSISGFYLKDGELKKFRRYRDKEEIDSSIENGYPLSVVSFRPIHNPARLAFACVMSTKNQQWTMRFIDILVGEDTHQDSQGYLYFPVRFNRGHVKPVLECSLAVSGYRFDSYAIYASRAMESR
jgi:hypothetical protein